MLDALVSGTTDPEVLAELARGRLRSKLPQLRDALEGSFSSHHALMGGMIVAHVDYLEEYPSASLVGSKVRRDGVPWGRGLAPSSNIAGAGLPCAEQASRLAGRVAAEEARAERTRARP